MRRRGGEQDQRHGGHDAGGGEQCGEPPALGREGRPLGGDQVGHREHGDRGQDRGLDGERLHGGEGASLLQEAVPGEREGERQRDRRELAVSECDHDHRERTECNCDPLQPAQAFAQHDHAQRDGHERVDEVAERSVDDAILLDRPDVHQPVRGDQYGSEGELEQASAFAQQRADPRPVTAERDHAQHDDERPQDPVSEDLQRARRCEQMEVDRERAPDRVRGDAGEDAGPGLTAGHATYQSWSV